jgi:hypothetical protein
MNMQFTDRYDALGIRPPSTLTVCRGLCEGTGVVPVRRPDPAVPATEHDLRLIALWGQAETAEPDDDGWHFVTCPDCAGSGRQRGNRLRVILRNLPRVLRQKARFARHHLLSTHSWRRDVPHPVWFNVRLGLRILLTSW